MPPRFEEDWIYFWIGLRRKCGKALHAMESIPPILIQDGWMDLVRNQS